MMRSLCLKKISREVVALLFIITPFLLNGQSVNYQTIKDFDYYKTLNNKESALPEFKDNDETLALKLIQLQVINESRKKFNAPPVKLDILASRVANKMCKEAAENDYVSHWNLNGEKPYMRYAFAGGNDHVTENAFGEWSSYTYDTSFQSRAKLMESAHNTFMAEKAPADGHKKNIIEENHNYVGIGFYTNSNQVRYYEEFIDRYYTFDNIPKELNINESGTITVSTDGKNWLNYLIIYREKMPVPMKQAQLKKTGSYQDYSNEIYLELPAWDLATYKNGFTYTIPIKFTKEGIYYIHIYEDKKEITKPVSISTEGKIQGSGIVIKVK